MSVMTDEPLTRLHRIYAAVGAAAEFDMTKIPGTVVHAKGFVGVHQDFSGGLNEHEIANLAHGVIHNIVALRDHLKKWAKENGKDVGVVDAAFNDSFDLQVLRDLWDREKHGGDPRSGGFSGKAPHLEYIRRQMIMKTQAKAGSFVTMTLGPRGNPIIAGDGSAKVVVTADVVGQDGSPIGELFALQERSIAVCESVLADLGVPLP